MSIQNIEQFSTQLSQSSPYFLGDGILESLPGVIKKQEFDRIYFVTNELLLRLYGKEICKTLLEHGIECKEIIIKDGEAYKNFTTLETLCDALVEEGITKDSIIISLGGGCLCNVVGLAASLIFRGIRYVEIPTTLMGLTDSSLSNKQAVNGRAGKNLFGSYHAPIFIWGDTQYIKSEKPQNIRAALVEGIKNALISDSDGVRFFDSEHIANLDKISSNEMLGIIQYIITSKQKILMKDPSEKGYALILEYGHTFGHAIEWITRGQVIHGYAVAIGMCIAAELSNRLGFLTKEEVALHYHLFEERLGISVSLPAGINSDEIMKTILSDNKKKKSGVGYILLDKIGQCLMQDGHCESYVEDAIVKEVVESYAQHGRKRKYA
ncbi:MAG TPA: 2-deoxy-scyllo-inosose synthase [Ruminiclostridium sp.]|nr:2-deoxy-scyllo-inosose synthase [Ruminiclostridium sp.]